MIGFRHFWSAANLMAGVEVVNMFYRGQFKVKGATISEQFEKLVG